MFIKLCAWCQKELNRHDDKKKKITVSHGICLKCKKKYIDNPLKKKKRR